MHLRPAYTQREGIFLNICIFDDDLQHAQIARNCIAHYAASVDLECDISMYTKACDLLERAAQDCKIDLLFSDIDIGQTHQNGIDVVKAIGELQASCQVVYLTSYLVFATEVYDTAHIYFVLKSDLKQRLPRIFNKVMDRNVHQPGRQQIFIKQKGKQIILPLVEIMYCEHHGRKTDIVTTRETIGVYLKMSELMADLNSRDFVHCHSSYIAHLRYVTEFRRRGFTMSNGYTIPISRSNYAETRQRFSNYI